MANRRGDWIQTFTGLQMYPLDATVEEICIQDIAHSLSNLCRFTGHCKSFYSVAQHSVLVSYLCKEEPIWGLLHDATEAYLSDVCRPIKPYLTGYCELEERLMGVICDRFNLAKEMPHSVQVADSIMLALEARDLMAPQPIPWDLGLAKGRAWPPLVIEPVPPLEAKATFLKRWEELNR